MVTGRYFGMIKEKIGESKNAILYRLLDGTYWLIFSDGLRFNLTEHQAKNWIKKQEEKNVT